MEISILDHCVRQRVKPAIQLLSSTMADTTDLLFKDDKRMKRFSNFVRDFDDFWDTCNSRSKYHSYKPLKAGFRSMTHIYISLKLD